MLFGRKSSVSWQDMSTLYQVVVCAKSLSAQTIALIWVLDASLPERVWPCRETAIRLSKERY